MSVVAAVADGQAVVRRARALFSTSGGADVPSGADQLRDATEAIGQARQRTAEMTGQGIPTYRDMAQQSIPPLTTAAGSDTSLTGRITSAAAVDAAGAQRLDAIAANTQTLADAAPNATTANQQRAILTALRGQLQQTQQVLKTSQQQDNSAASAIRDLTYPKDTHDGKNDGTQALDDKDNGSDKKRNPLAPPPPTPPHGHDPHYWIDVTKIIHVPDGELAPNGTKQIGPNLWYPSTDQGLFVTGDPPAAKWPIDMKQIEQLPPGQLPQMGMTELGPGFYAPTPRGHDVPPSSWLPPQAPIDIRDIVHIAPGALAPNGYREYAPGWWAPDVSNDGFPHLPPRR